ncbi:hypothetical protein BKI52_05500 [marine bacterium AO1-C]|nr:hypothetical protein BKI52_05500 [marine bacterium AO1-C]
MQTSLQIHRNIRLVSQHDDKPFGLDAFYQDNDVPKPVVVFVHGFNGFKDWGHWDATARNFAEAGFVFVKFNLSHNGTSMEHLKAFVDLEAYGHDYYTTDLDDIDQVINYLHSDDCPFRAAMDLENLYLVGHSRGGGLVLIKTAEDSRVKAATTWASIGDTRFFWKENRLQDLAQDGVTYYVNGRTQQKLPLYQAYYDNLLENAERLSLERAIKAINVPLLLTHGDQDEAVAVELAHQLQAWQPNAELFIIEGAMHTFGGYEPYDKDDLMPLMQQNVDKTIEFFKGV